MSSSRRLDSWKEIAVYLHRSVRTVQRWEREERLPVHRLDHKLQATVYAFTEELDEWLAAHSQRSGLEGSDTATIEPESIAAVESAPALEPSKNSRRTLLWVGAGVAAAGVPLARWILRARKPRHRLWRPLEGTARQSWPSLSSDGNELVWVETIGGESIVKSTDLRSSRTKVLVPRQANRGAILPQFAPDGSHLAWLEPGERGLWDLMLAPPQVNERRCVASIDGAWFHWTTDSERILFADRSRPDEPVAAHLVFLQQEKRWQVSRPPKGSWGDILVACSPDHEHFAVARYLSPGDGDLYLLDWKGTETRRLTEIHAWIGGIGFSPDGSELLFDSVIDRVQGLYRVAVTGVSKPRPVPTPGIQTPRYPRAACLQNGRERTIFQNDGWRCRGLWGRIAEGSVKDIRFFAGLQATIEKPMLAPNGNALAWVLVNDDAHTLMLGDRQGNEGRPIARFPQGLDDPIWSPDGRFLAVTAWANPKPFVWVVDVSTGEARRLTSEQYAEGVASWSADQRWIYFRSERDGVSRFWRVSWSATGRTEGKPEPVTAAAVDGREGIDGWFLFIDSGQRGLLKRVKTGQARPNAEVHPNAPELRAGMWRILGNALLYVDVAESLLETRLYRQELRPPNNRRQVAKLPTFPASLVGCPSLDSNWSEVVWAQRETRKEIWMLEG